MEVDGVSMDSVFPRALETDMAAKSVGSDHGSPLVHSPPVASTSPPTAKSPRRAVSGNVGKGVSGHERPSTEQNTPFRADMFAKTSNKLTRSESLDKRSKTSQRKGSQGPAFRADLFVNNSSSDKASESSSKDDKADLSNPKPQISYAIIISDVIDKSAAKKLTLNDIYLAIQDKYPYFKTATPSWKNSIRHNLSLNRAFIKIPRQSDEVGKGFFWGCDMALLEQRKPMARTGMSKRRNTVGEGSTQSKGPLSRRNSQSERSIPSKASDSGHRRNTISEPYAKADMVGRSGTNAMARGIVKRLSLHSSLVKGSHSMPTSPVVASPPSFESTSDLYSMHDGHSSIASKDAEISDLLDKVNIDYSALQMGAHASVLKAQPMATPSNLQLGHLDSRHVSDPNLRDFDVNMFLTGVSSSASRVFGDGNSNDATDEISGLVELQQRMVLSGGLGVGGLGAHNHLNLYGGSLGGVEYHHQYASGGRTDFADFRTAGDMSKDDMLLHI